MVDGGISCRVCKNYGQIKQTKACLKSLEYPCWKQHMLLNASVSGEDKIEGETAEDPASVTRPGTSSSIYKQGELRRAGHRLLRSELGIITETVKESLLFSVYF